MNERISDERIAQLLDGTISSDERAELLSRLAADGDDFAVFAETGGVLREAEEAESAPDPLPLVDAPPAAPDVRTAVHPGDGQAPPSTRRPSRWGGRRARWLALVPVLALAVLVPLLWRRGDAGGPGAPALALGEATLPDNWLNGGRPWSKTRGGTDPTDSEARAARIGAFHADLALAIASRDSQSTVLLIIRINHLLGQEVGADTMKYVEIATRAGGPPAELQPLLDDAGEQVMEYMDADRVRLGAWAEGALIAAERRDTAFFLTPGMRRAFGRAAGDDTLPPEASEAADNIRKAARRIHEASPAEWNALKRDADTILAAIGRAAPPPM